MGKKGVKKMASKVITTLGVKSASIAVSQTCAMFYYQPKTPKQLKSKTKFR